MVCIVAKSIERKEKKYKLANVSETFVLLVSIFIYTGLKDLTEFFLRQTVETHIFTVLFCSVPDFLSGQLYEITLNEPLSLGSARMKRSHEMLWNILNVFCRFGNNYSLDVQ